MLKNKLNYKLLNILMIITMIYLAINTFNWWSIVIKSFFSLVFPFFIAFILAYSIYPCVRKLQNLGIRKSIAIASVIIILLCITIFLFYITIPILYAQIISLSKIVYNVIIDISARFEIDLEDIKNASEIVFGNIIEKLGKYISRGMLNILTLSIDFITKSLVVIIVSIYLLIDMDKIKYRIRTILKKINKKALKYVETLDNEMCNYLQGLVISILIQFVEYSFLFLIVGHPNWLLLGMLASLTTIVPYFGTLVTNIIAVILASAVSLNLFIATALICLIFPNIDGYIISPKIYGKTNNINPIWTIFAIFIGGKLLGIIGIIVAVPVYIFINCTYNFFKKDLYLKFSKSKN